MARVIGVIGESGSGKTTSCRNLDPATTYYIDCDKKGLSWKGWREQYNLQNKNYYATNVPTLVLEILKKVNEDPDRRIKTVVIDTINGVMVAEEMRNAKVQGYGKWTDLAQYVWEIFEYALSISVDTVLNGVTILSVEASLSRGGELLKSLRQERLRLGDLTFLPPEKKKKAPRRVPPSASAE